MKLCGRGATPISSDVVGATVERAIPLANGRPVLVIETGYPTGPTELGYDDYAGLDVTGKVVLVIRKEPRANEEGEAFAGNIEQRADTIRRCCQFGNDLVDLLEFRFTLLRDGLRQDHRMAELIQQLLSRIPFGKGGQTLLDQFERISSGLQRRFIAPIVGFILFRSSAITHEEALQETTPNDPTIRMP